MEYTPEQLYALRASPLVRDVPVPVWVTKQGMDTARTARPEFSNNNKQQQQHERGDRPDRGDRLDRGERGDRPDRDRGDRGDRGDRLDRGDGRDRERERGKGRDRRGGGGGDRDRDHFAHHTEEWDVPGRPSQTPAASTGFARSRGQQHGSNVKAFDEDFAALATGGRPPPRLNAGAGPNSLSRGEKATRGGDLNGEDDPRGKTVDDFERFRQQMKQQQQGQSQQAKAPVKEETVTSTLSSMQLEESQPAPTISAPPGFNIQPSTKPSTGTSINTGNSSSAAGKPAGTSKFSKFFAGGSSSEAPSAPATSTAEPVKNKEDAEGFERILAMLSAQGDSGKQQPRSEQRVLHSQTRPQPPQQQSRQSQPQSHQQHPQQQQHQQPHNNSILGHHTQNNEFFMSLLSNPQVPRPGPYGMYGAYGPPPPQQGPPPPPHMQHQQQQHQQRHSGPGPGPYYDPRGPMMGGPGSAGGPPPPPPGGLLPGMMPPGRQGMPPNLPPQQFQQQQHPSDRRFGQPPPQQQPQQQQQQQSQYELDPRIRPSQYYGQ